MGCVSKVYRRMTGCLSRAAADRLWHDLVAYRKATRQPQSFARRKYGAGYALYEVIEQQEAPPSSDAERGLE